MRGTEDQVHRRADLHAGAGLVLSQALLAAAAERRLGHLLIRRGPGHRAPGVQEARRRDAEVTGVTLRMEIGVWPEYRYVPNAGPSGGAPGPRAAVCTVAANYVRRVIDAARHCCLLSPRGYGSFLFQ